MTDFELDPAEHLTIGALGPPGERVFMIQARGVEGTVGIIIEKFQALAFSDASRTLLQRFGIDEPVRIEEEDMAIDDSVEPAWRAGQVTVEYDEERERVVIECQELVEEGEEAGLARFVTTRSQFFKMTAQAIIVASKGRPVCPLCSKPINEGEEHRCFATNGHRRPGEE